MRLCKKFDIFKILILRHPNLVFIFLPCKIAQLVKKCWSHLNRKFAGSFATDFLFATFLVVQWGILSSKSFGQFSNWWSSFHIILPDRSLLRLSPPLLPLTRSTLHLYYFAFYIVWQKLKTITAKEFSFKFTQKDKDKSNSPWKVKVRTAQSEVVGLWEGARRNNQK